MSSGITGRSWVGHAGAVLGVAATTAICAPLHDVLTDTTVALTFLLVVLVVATVWGSWPALLASVLGVLCFNSFFLAPEYTLTLADPRSFVALTAFLVTAIAVGQLSARARRLAAEAEEGRKEAKRQSVYNRSLIEASLDAMVAIGRDGRITDVNAATEALTGAPRAALIDTRFSDCFTEPEKAQAGYERAFREGIVRDYTLKVRHRAGYTIPVLYNASVYHDETGAVAGVFAAARIMAAPPYATGEAIGGYRQPAPEPVEAGRDAPAIARAGGAVPTLVLRAILAALPPVACLALQWVFWPTIQPFAWFLFYPAVFFSSWIGGFSAGLVSTAVSAVLIWWAFLPPERSFVKGEPTYFLMAAVAVGMGILFSFLHARLRRATRQATDALAAVESANRTLRDANDEITRLVEEASEGIFLTDLDGRCTDVNRAGCRMLRYRRDQIVGRSLFEVVPPAEVPRARQAREQLLAGGIHVAEWNLRRSDGTYLPVEVSGKILPDGRWQCLVRDVSERRRAEGALRESEARLKRAQEIAHVGSWHLDLRRDLLTWSDEVFRIFGVPIGTPLTYEAFLDAIHPEDRSAVQAAWTAALRGAPYDIVHRIVVAGAVKWVRERAEVEFDADGHPVTGVGTAQDVTQRKNAEDGIRLLARLQAAVAELGQRALERSPAVDLQDEAVALVGRCLAVEYASVFERLPDGSALLLRSGTGWTSGHVGRATVDGTTSEAGYTARHREPVIVEDVRGETRFVPTAALLDEPSVVSTMSVAIPTREGAYGALGAHTRRQRAFTGDEVHFLQAIANVLGMAIEQRRAEEDLLRINRAHRALSSCNEALIRAEDESAWLEQVCRIIVEEAGYRLCWVGRAEHDVAKRVRPVARAGVDDGYLDRLHVTWADTEHGRGPAGTAVRTGQPQVVKDIASDPRFAPWRADALARGYRSNISIPLVVDGAPFGALTIYAPEIDAFGEEEVRLLSELSADLGYGVTSLRGRAERARAEEGLRTLNAELEMRVTARTAQLQAANALKDELIDRERATSAALAEAREREAAIGFRIQQMLLLREPPREVPGLQLAALTIPSQRIDGDFYDFFAHENRCLDLIVADVMGKGIPAALLAAATKSHFLEAQYHLMAASRIGALPEPREIVSRVHTQLVEYLIELESFVTLSYARVDPDRRTLDLVDCGHTGTMVVRAGTLSCDVVQGENLPLGIRRDEVFEQIAVPFEAGDVFLFYSDGITDMRAPSGERFGTRRLAECFRANHGLEPEALVEAIRATAMAFAGSACLADDFTCVVVRVGERQPALAHGGIEIGSDLRELARAREFVHAFCSDLPGASLDDASVGALVLAVNEAACNIMKHAYRGRTDRRIQLESEAFPGHVAIRLHHVGDPFDPSAVSPPALDGSRESGFGVYLIQKSVDGVRYSRDERGRSCVALVKRTNRCT